MVQQKMPTHLPWKSQKVRTLSILGATTSRIEDRGLLAPNLKIKNHKMHETCIPKSGTEKPITLNVALICSKVVDIRSTSTQNPGTEVAARKLGQGLAALQAICSLGEVVQFLHHSGTSTMIGSTLPLATLP